MNHDDQAQIDYTHFRGSRILLLDHRSEFLKLFYEALLHQGYTIRLVFNTPELLSSSEGWNPDLIGIVSGGLFPGLPDVCRRLRITSGAPILVLSTAVHEKILVDSLEAGATDFVTLPRSMAEITARIRSQLRRSSPASSADQDAA